MIVTKRSEQVRKERDRGWGVEVQGGEVGSEREMEIGDEKEEELRVICIPEACCRCHSSHHFI